MHYPLSNVLLRCPRVHVRVPGSRCRTLHDAPPRTFTVKEETGAREREAEKLRLAECNAIGWREFGKDRGEESSIHKWLGQGTAARRLDTVGWQIREKGNHPEMVGT